MKGIGTINLIGILGYAGLWVAGIKDNNELMMWGLIFAPLMILLIAYQDNDPNNLIIKFKK